MSLPDGYIEFAGRAINTKHIVSVGEGHDSIMIETSNNQMYESCFRYSKSMKHVLEKIQKAQFKVEKVQQTSRRKLRSMDST